jgi:signal transduction histidine kinase
MMRRLVNLVTRLSAACDSAVSVRQLADVACQALVETFPGALAVVFEREPNLDTLRAVAGASIPEAWQMRAVHLHEVPIIGEALREPTRVVQSATKRRAAATAGAPAAAVTMQAFCGAVPDPEDPVYVLLLIAPPEPGEGDLREVAVETARRMLGLTAALTAGDAERSRTLSAIYHAKIEWERTADALPEVVGLLDRRRRIVRVNKSLERWLLGTVQDSLGHDLHAVLHPSCGDDRCEFRCALAGALDALDEHGEARFELADPTLGLDLAFEFRIASNPGGQPTRPWQRVAFVVSNITSLRHVERNLKSLNQTLEHRVGERTAELTATNRALRDEVARRRDAEESLLASQRELEGLSERLMTAQEEERTRIAQDLHDSVGQSLSAIKYSLERAQVLARRQDARSAADVVEQAVERVRRVMDEVRGISMNLRPAVLDDLGAASAVRSLCREWHEVYGEIAIDAAIDVDDADIPPMLGTNVYRAVQESLNNVARHAGAHRVQVGMRLEDGTLLVTVQDDGTGFAISGDVRRLVDRPDLRGLRGLRERAERSGGRCMVSSAPGQGTLVRLEWPVVIGTAARQANARLN